MAAVGIQCQTQLSPASTGSDAMLLLQPLARAINLRTSAVHQNMQRSGNVATDSGPAVVEARTLEVDGSIADSAVTVEDGANPVGDRNGRHGRKRRHDAGQSEEFCI